VLCGFLYFLVCSAAGLGSPPLPLGPTATLTKVDQLSLLAAQGGKVSYPCHLEGTLWWVSGAQHRLVLVDASGAALVELDYRGPRGHFGQHVRIEGRGTIVRNGPAFRVGAVGAVVDNNGVHAFIEKSGSVYLTAGFQPLLLQWFNGVERYGLEVEYEGSGTPRQRIPEARLARHDSSSSGGDRDPIGGLEFRCYEGAWQVLPDFSQLTPTRAGSVMNFDLGVRTRDENVGLEFRGYLDVPQEGDYTFYLKSDDGSRLFVGQPTMDLEILGEAPLPTPRPMAIGHLFPEVDEGQWVVLEGKVTLARELPTGLELEMGLEAGRMRVEFPEDTGLSTVALQNRRIRVTGFGQPVLTPAKQRVAGVLWVPDASHIQWIDPPAEVGSSEEGGLPELTAASEIHRLRREEAQRAYPVRLQGVVTGVLPELQAFTLQDATRGIYVVDVSTNRTGPPHIGDYLELEGVTDPGLFAPFVNARRVWSMGAGLLPEPVHPTWDQLMIGSLDAQYVEIQCVMTDAQSQPVSVLVPGGVLKAEVRMIGGDSGRLRSRENDLVRLRGCLLARWDYVTHQVKAGEIRLYDTTVLTEQPANPDPFSCPARSASDLRLFDPEASVFQRVRVAGQIVHIDAGQYFMMDGSHGLRFTTKRPIALEPGDFAEVVGFPDAWSGSSPVLREAAVRAIRHALLPKPQVLKTADLMRADCDSTLVQVEAVLVGVRKAGLEQVLEMQSGTRTFEARLRSQDESLQSLAPGSRLALTGVYATQGRTRVGDDQVGGLALLLGSPADLEVRARPPWWTLKHFLAVLGALAFVLVGAASWITQLRHLVEQRTVELEFQIRKRQRAEHQRAMEEERARVAQDLHDELGCGLTEVSMLAARSNSVSATGPERSQYLDQVAERARAMVAALDEIVWAMNPRHDSLASLVSYFCLHAERFLGLANISWHLEGPTGSADPVMDSRRRHQLFLAFKEALTNVVRHSGATEVRMSIHIEDAELSLEIADNGRGLPDAPLTESMDGVSNMRSRIERLGGQFSLVSVPGQSTTVRFRVPTN